MSEQDDARQAVNRFHQRWASSFASYEAGCQALVDDLRFEAQKRHLLPARDRARTELAKLERDLQALASRLENPLLWEWADVRAWDQADETLDLMRKAAEFFARAAANLPRLTKDRPQDRLVAALFLVLRQTHGKPITLSREGPVAAEFVQLHAAAQHFIDTQTAYDQLVAARKALTFK